MPNRILREGIVDSPAIDSLSDFAECLYHRMIVMADDAGRMDARPTIIASKCYPAKSLTERKVSGAIAEIAAAKLVAHWTVGGKSVMQLSKWQKCGKALKSRFPDTEGSFDIRYVQQDTRDGEKAFIDTSLHGVGMGSVWGADGVSPKTNTETETETDKEDGDGDGISTEPQAASAQPVASFPVNGSTKDWGLTRKLHGEFGAAYPHLDLEAEYAKARAWLVSNPKKLKTVRGMPAFLNRWLERAQNRGGNRNTGGDGFVSSLPK